MKCPKCGSRDIDFQESIGQSICVNCGTVLEENTIVSSIEFQESGDRSHVVGHFISASGSKPYSGGRPMGGHGEGRDPRDATLVNARRTIAQVASTLRLSSLYIDRAFRLYQLALQRNFIFGRKQLHVVATCLYIICRQEKSPHLLIDFSDALQINVYVLGKSFLQFSKVLNLNLPVVDPSLYIHRYATRLDLGESRASVVATSLRIITRLKKDWITTGRRPDGICALAMLVAARAHDFDVNQEVICKLFRVSPDLLRRRIEDFRSIPSAQLTLEQFHTNDAEIEFDPPSYIRNVVQDSLNSQYNCLKDEQEGDYFTHEPRTAKVPRTVHLALPSSSDSGVTQGNGAQSSVSALVAAAHLQLGRAGASGGSASSAGGSGASNSKAAKDKSGCNTTSGESSDEGSVHDSADEGGDNEILKSSDNLEGDEVYQQQQYSSRLRSNHPSGAAGAGSSSRGNGVSAQGGDDSSEDEELFMLNGMKGAGSTNRGGRHDLRAESGVIDGGFFNTKIADIDIVVPIPGQRKRRKMTESASLKLQQRKDLYEDVYQDVLEGCEATAAPEVIDALQREAQLIEDANEGVGGWGEQTKQFTRIKERRIVLCLDNSTAAINSTAATSSTSHGTASSSAGGAGGSAGAGSSSSRAAVPINATSMTGASAATTAPKIKFRRLNNGADATIIKTAAGEGADGEEEGEPDPDSVLEGELNRYLLTEDEQKKRSLIWEKTFRPFMDERESRRKARERDAANNTSSSDRYTQGGKLRRKYTRKAMEAAANKGAAGAAGGAAATTSQAVLFAQTQSKASKKINYDALKGVFGQDGSFAAPAAVNAAALSGSSSSHPKAVSSTASAGQAYLDSLMGITGTATYAAPVYTTNSFAKDVRDTVLGSSIANSKAPRAQRSILSAGNAVSSGRSSKLGPAVAASSGAHALSAALTAANTAANAASSAGKATLGSAAAAAYNEDLLDNDEGEEDQLLYEGGGDDQGDYDDYDDEYY